MGTETSIGKIEKIDFGFGGYQDAQLGFSFTFSGKGWGVGWFEGYWATERSERTQWTEEDRLRHLGEASMFVKKLMEDAKVTKLSDLQGIPVEVTFKDRVFDSVRILTEVL